jgi:hypothetical protein
MEARRNDPYPRCAQVKIQTNFVKFRAIFGDPETAPYMTNAEFVGWELLYYNDLINPSTVPTHEVSFEAFVDQTLPGPTGQNDWNYYGWIRSKFETYAEVARSYPWLVTQNDASCPNLGVTSSQFTNIP